ncbi:hypothetical protein [Mycobacterium bourgelatii]|uniref:hypothetical protein n=1 Tax=Mycobacterium bourgelatii TaxID=1273442 RepID=UPI0013CFDA75|nr:hypothetical protein [Mycobacterium bourgelatii]MCV6974214.1 hypothetical protein [Mycobacterium bourgelatii]
MFSDVAAVIGDVSVAMPSGNAQNPTAAAQRNSAAIIAIAVWRGDHRELTAALRKLKVLQL